jgi:hypothetical protein
MCKKEFEDDNMAIEIRLGYVDSSNKTEPEDQYFNFQPECAWAPICDECTIEYIKNENNNGKKH